MTPELIAIIAVGVALAGLLLANNHQVGKLLERVARVETILEFIAHPPATRTEPRKPADAADAP